MYKCKKCHSQVMAEEKFEQIKYFTIRKNGKFSKCTDKEYGEPKIKYFCNSVYCGCESYNLEDIACWEDD